MRRSNSHTKAIQTTLESLLELYKTLRQEKKEKFDRVLPLSELIVDRWEKAQYLKFGDKVSIYDSSLVFGKVTVGASTWIGPFTILDGTGGLSIGKFCNIGSGVHIYTHDTIAWVLSGGKKKYRYAPVKIGSYTYIAPHTIITKGVTIGQRCLIGANSIVNKDIPDNSIAFGSTCKIVGKVQVNKDGTVNLEYTQTKNSLHGS